jgi:uridine phosphorylase
MTKSQRSLLPEYAGTGPAIIEPSKTKPRGVRLPSRVVLCFFWNIIKELEKRKEVTTVHHLSTGMAPLPIYTLGSGRERVALCHPGLGSSMVAACLEELIALGARNIIACGGAGVLDSNLPVGSVIIPTGAIRDEGTSLHYQPRGRINRPHPQAVRAIKAACKHHGTPFKTGLTWTTDAIYRETPRKILSRKREGCLTVEMEAAAFFAVARFRKVAFGQILYAGDDVSGSEWDARLSKDRPTARQKLLLLAIDAVRRLG